MLTSTLGVVAVAALALLAFGVLNPVLALIIVVLAGTPFVLAAVGGIFGRAASRQVTSGPSVPSTRDASYDPTERS